MQKNSRLVYSDSLGRLCPQCEQQVNACRCKRQQPVRTGDGIVRLGRETKGRKGKGVTLISGVPLDEAGLKNLARELKQLCGTGGTLKDGVIEIQGDQRDKLLPVLQRKGWTVKRSGG
jgi:translation initiation factor 1